MGSGSPVMAHGNLLRFFARRTATTEAWGFHPHTPGRKEAAPWDFTES